MDRSKTLLVLRPGAPGIDAHDTAAVKELLAASPCIREYVEKRVWRYGPLLQQFMVIRSTLPEFIVREISGEAIDEDVLAMCDPEV